jgi:hypothetical protein
MPSAYEIALLLARLIAAVNLVVGIFSIVGSAFAALVTGLVLPMFDGLAFNMLSYGVTYTIAGAGLLIFSKRIAMFASKG